MQDIFQALGIYLSSLCAACNGKGHFLYTLDLSCLVCMLGWKAFISNHIGQHFSIYTCWQIFNVQCTHGSSKFIALDTQSTTTGSGGVFYFFFLGHATCVATVTAAWLSKNITGRYKKWKKQKHPVLILVSFCNKPQKSTPFIYIWHLVCLQRNMHHIHLWNAAYFISL